MYNIGIIGLGFVGGAMFKSFTLKSINLEVYDKYKNGGIGSLDNMCKKDFLFLCLPTIFDEKKNSYNKDPIYETCEFLEKNEYKGIVIIKSTVEPETTKKLCNKYKLKFVHNPEFLSAATAFLDFDNQKHIVLGKTLACSTEDLNKLSDFYKKNFPNADISICSSTESESMKSFVNCFYSVKIQFFNELYLLCQKTNCDYNKIKALMIKNGWISPYHTQVPGTDGKLSYGGYCFPKDTNALLQFMKNKGSRYKLLEATILERNEMRSDHINCKINS